jgi:hypothetical protein
LGDGNAVACHLPLRDIALADDFRVTGDFALHVGTEVFRRAAYGSQGEKKGAGLEL